MGIKSDLNKLNRFKERVDKAKADINRFQGELNGLLKGLKEKHGVNTLKQAERKLKQLKKQKDVLIGKFREQLSKIEGLMEEDG